MTDKKPSEQDSTSADTPTKKTAPKKAAKSTEKTSETLSSIQSVLNEMKNERESRDVQLSQLFNGLDIAFNKVNTASSERENFSTQSINKLTESIMLEHETALKKLQEQEVLVDKKLGYLTELQQQQSVRNKWFAIPGIILGVFAVIYMFYLVNVIETAMTSMSKDMRYITASVNTMSQDAHALNVNMGQMTRDMNVMTHNVAPAMNGMRNAMPWAP
ncbi:MAG: hypothetical protein OEY61_11570 [Gammaproteobacteria bacterium]|nr:hypothetical protein [Gammaproteobacteria bacterium]